MIFNIGRLMGAAVLLTALAACGASGGTLSSGTQATQVQQQRSAGPSPAAANSSAGSSTASIANQANAISNQINAIDNQINSANSGLNSNEGDPTQ